jgi:hypothetical protein
MFLTMFAPPVAYHTLLTNFTQIGLRKNERIQDFKLRFNKTLSKIPEDKIPNDPMILVFIRMRFPKMLNILSERPIWIPWNKQ